MNLLWALLFVDAPRRVNGLKMKPLIGLVTTVALSVGLVACGGGTRDSPISGPSANATDSTATAINSKSKDANDGDIDSNSNDDREVFDYGHAAGAADKQMIVALVRRYYGAAAKGDGVAVCARIYSLMAKAIVEDYGEYAGPANLRGKTCAVVESKAYKRHPHVWATKASTVDVIGVRTDGANGLAILRFGKKATPRYIRVRVESGVWKVYSISDDSRLP